MVLGHIGTIGQNMLQLKYFNKNHTKKIMLPYRALFSSKNKKKIMAPYKPYFSGQKKFLMAPYMLSLKIFSLFNGAL